MPRIMLVDDDYSVLSSLRRCIQQMPANSFRSPVIVEIFERPQLALARAAECEFDLVLADWRMPAMDGISFMTELIKIQPDVVRMVLSADDRFRRELDAIGRLKIFHFISKPWNPDILRVLLRLALDSRPANRSVFKPQRRPVDLEFQQFAPDAIPAHPFAPLFRVKSGNALSG